MGGTVLLRMHHLDIRLTQLFRIIQPGPGYLDPATASRTM